MARIGIIDTGFEINHRLTKGFVDLAGSVDHVDGNTSALYVTGPDGRPAQHGQMVLGSMAWDGAYNPSEHDHVLNAGSKVELHNTNLSTGHIAAALAATRDCDAVNMSFGFTIPFVDTLYNSTVLTQIWQPMQAGATTGRGGLGVTYVVAAGNSRAYGDDSTFHTLQNNEFAIAVAAFDRNEASASFSSRGENILTSALGVSVETTVIPTFSGGYETALASGTSFAAPKLAAVVGQIIDANPTLGYRDVAEIIALASRDPRAAGELDVANGAKGWNGGGLSYSREYGFGVIDAKAAVALAQSWEGVQTRANVATAGGSFTSPGQALTQNAAFTKTFTIDRSIDVEHVNLRLELTHADLNDLVIEIVSPSGTVSRVMDHSLGANSGGTLNFDFGVRRFMGEDARGVWTIRVLDDRDPTQGGTLRRLDLRVTGATGSEDDVYVFTDDFSANWTRERGTFSDALGANTLNFAAMRAAVSLDLGRTGASVVAGASFALTETARVAKVHLGEGADRLVGSDRAETVWARGGDDALFMMGGDDLAHAGAGTDRIDGGAGVDTVAFAFSLGAAALTLLADGWAQVVSGAQVTLTYAVEFFRFGAVTVAVEARLFANRIDGLETADALAGTAGADLIAAKGGDDLVRGSAGSDTIDGGAGTDTVSYAELGAAVILADGKVTKSGGADALAGVEKVVGTGFADRLAAGAGVTALDGGAGADTLTGSAGDDLLTGGAGADAIDGGAGADVAAFAAARGGFSFAEGAGGALLVTDRATGEVDALLNVETLRFTDGDRAVADVLAELRAPAGLVAFVAPAMATWIANDALSTALRGGAGNDGFRSGGGHDSLYGGAGFDMADYSADRAIVYNNGAVRDGYGGTDRLTDVEMIRGSAYADQAWGWDAAFVFDGGAGNDLIRGGKAADTLIGGAGDDQIWAYRPDSAATVAQSNLATRDQLFGGDGADRLWGSAGDNLLDGGRGADRIDGGAGTDIAAWSGARAGYAFAAGAGGALLVTDRATGETDFLFGVETLRFSDGDTAVSALSLGDAAAVAAPPSGLVAFVAPATATWIANDGRSTALRGGAGNDGFRSGGGHDSLYGGAGFDMADYSADRRTIAYNNGAVLDGYGGIDRLYEVEMVRGSAYADQAWGWDAAFVFDGGAGNDVIRGGKAADTLIGGAGDDQIWAYRPDSAATVAQSNLATHDQLFGGDGADRLWGSAGDNLLDGGRGVDTIDGGAGTDIAAWSGARAGYAFAEGVGGALLVTDRATGETDFLFGVETLRFSDGDVLAASLAWA